MHGQWYLLGTILWRFVFYIRQWVYHIFLRKINSRNLPCDTYILFFLYLRARHCTLGVICQHTDNVGVGDIDEFNRNNFKLGKFKLKMRLVPLIFGHFGKIQESSIIQCWSQSKERIPKLCKKNHHCIQLSTKLIWYMKGCKTPLNAWKNPLQRPLNEEFVQYFFIRHKCLGYKMQEDDKLLNHLQINSLVWRYP